MVDAAYIATVATAHLANATGVTEAFLARRRLPTLEFNNGFRIFHGPDDTVADLFHEIFVRSVYTGQGFYTPRPGDVVLDCGANIGMFAVFICAASPGVSVHCFEPAAGNLQRLAQNVACNGLERQVRIHPYAVLDHEGTCTLRPARCNGERSLFDRGVHDPSKEEHVACVTLAHALMLCGDPRIDLLKLDVEAAEIEILEGASGVHWDRVRRVALEYHDFIRPGCRVRSCAALGRYGFSCAVDAGDDSGTIGVIRAGARALAGVLRGHKRGSTGSCS